METRHTGLRKMSMPHFFSSLAQTGSAHTKLGEAHEPYGPRTSSSPVTITKADVTCSYKLDYGSRLRRLVVLPT